MKEQIKEQIIFVPEGKRAECVCGVLTLVDEQPLKVVNPLFDKNIPITERVKTFADAMALLGENHPFVWQYNDWECRHSNVEDDNDILAYLKLRIITAALNEGWSPQFTKSEFRWFPLFVFHERRNVDCMSDEERSRVVHRSGCYSSAYGFACASAYSAYSNTFPCSLARFSLRTKELAVYAGEQFLDIWAVLMFKSEDLPSDKVGCSIKAADK